MRYYRIDITNPTTNAAVVFASLQGLPLSSLLPNGNTNIAALNVELDIPVAPYAQPAGQAFLKIWGLGLQDIGNASNLNDMLISVSGGMQQGLPLANPKQSGLLVKGQIFQAFGNWVGTEQTIDVVLLPSTGDQTTPLNIVLNWQAGQPMSTAIQNTLKTAFPSTTVMVAISSSLVLQHDEVGYHYTLSEFSELVKRLSKAINPSPNYPGVDVSYNGSTITVSDSTSPPQPKMIAFQDLIGQPTWRSPSVIQAKFVMRADLNLFDVLTLPKSLATTTQEALLRFQDKSTFSGNYIVTSIHHYGNFRQQDAASWNTTVDMTPQIS